jgi:hypothetical protein
MFRSISKKGYVAVVPPEFRKIEARIEGGLARLDQRTKVLVTPLVMDYRDDSRSFTVEGGWCAILEGDSGLKPWAKKRMEINGVEFCLVPESEVIGFYRPTAPQDCCEKYPEVTKT